MKHIVGFSGGIDSQAMAALVLDAYDACDVIILNSPAGGNEDPLTYEHIDWYSKNIHPVITVPAMVSDLWLTEGAAEERGFDGNEELDFPRLIELKGPPLRRRRTCTEFLKLVPQRRWMAENFGVGGQYDGEDFERYTGVRRDESEARKDTPDREWDGYFDCWLNHPVAKWSKQKCFDFVMERGERINPLYALGFERVGCAPCILSGKDDLLRWFQRRPEMIDKVRLWEARTGFTFFQKMVPGLATNRIDEVIVWAQTSRGGRQQNMFRVLNDRPTCESKYGLCE